MLKTIECIFTESMIAYLKSGYKVVNNYFTFALQSCKDCSPVGGFITTVCRRKSENWMLHAAKLGEPKSRTR